MTNILDIGELDLPRNVLVMGGNWEPLTQPDELLLSLESRIRVQALGVLATHGLVNTAIFTAGLTRGPEVTPEAAEQHRYLHRQFPRLSPFQVIEEDLGHTTVKDAVHTAEIVAKEEIEGPFTLITSQAFLRRQAKIFERHGFDIVPQAAEPLVAARSAEHAAFIKQYRRSPRYAKMLASEAILRGLAVVDPNSVITERLAARSRPNHN